MPDRQVWAHLRTYCAAAKRITQPPTHHCAKQSRSRPGPRRVMKTFAMAALILLAFFAELGTLG
jgi:hypothetical protein